MNPNHNITVSVVGCGGTGSYVVSQLAKMSISLKTLNGYGLFVKVYDNDKVEEHNVGRQLFSKADIGRYKSDVIVERVNRFYGLEWESITKKVSYNANSDFASNIIISCVDSMKSRRSIFKLSKKLSGYTGGYNRIYYWMDFGNSKDFGQYFIQNIEEIEQPEVKEVIKDLPDIFKNFKNEKDDKKEPSCSVSQSLMEQDLFINLQLAVSGVDLLWKFLKNHYITFQGQYINTGTGKHVPMNL